MLLNGVTFERDSLIPQGIGAYKLGANYAPGLIAQKEAAKKGYVQNLWLYGPEHYVTEVWQNIARYLRFDQRVGRSAL